MTGTVTINVASACATLNCTNNGGTLAFGNYVLTVTAAVTLGGTITAGTGGLTITGAASMTSGGITFPGAMVFNYAAGAITFVDNWTISGAISYSGNPTTLNRTDATHGNLTYTGALTATRASSGTSDITFGTGSTWSGSGPIANNVIFNGNSTVSGTVGFKTGTMTYTSGTVTTTGSKLTINGACTLNTDGITWNNTTVSLTFDITLGSDFTATGVADHTTTRPWRFVGAYDVTFGTFRSAGGAVSHIIPAGQTLTVTDALYLNGVDNQTMEIKSGTASTHAHFVYSGDKANCQIYEWGFTDIDSSGSTGGGIDNWYGATLTRTTGITNRTSADIGGASTGGGWFAGE